MSDQQPATKQDLLHVEERVAERVRDMQTEVLRAFHNWARPAEIKTRSHEERRTLPEERRTLLEERIRDIERDSAKH